LSYPSEKISELIEPVNATLTGAELVDFDETGFFARIAASL